LEEEESSNTFNSLDEGARAVTQPLPGLCNRVIRNQPLIEDSELQREKGKDYILVTDQVWNAILRAGFEFDCDIVL
jgi:hypothetical protein